MSKGFDNMAISHRWHYLKLKFENHSYLLLHGYYIFCKSDSLSKKLLKDFGGIGTKMLSVLKQLPLSTINFIVYIITKSLLESISCVNRTQSPHFVSIALL